MEDFANVQALFPTRRILGLCSSTRVEVRVVGKDVRQIARWISWTVFLKVAEPAFAKRGFRSDAFPA